MAAARDLVTLAPRVLNLSSLKTCAVFYLQTHLICVSKIPPIFAFLVPKIQFFASKCEIMVATDPELRGEAALFLSGPLDLIARFF